MDAVAGLAGVSKLTVYSHFTDKETLFSSAIMSKCTEQLPVLFFELLCRQADQGCIGEHCPWFSGADQQ